MFLKNLIFKGSLKIVSMQLLFPLSVRKLGLWILISLEGGVREGYF